MPDIGAPGRVYEDHLSRNFSSRSGVRPRMVCLHTTEGANRPGLSDLQGLKSWFNNAAANASSHWGVDAEGNAAQFVEDHLKAWTCGAYNSISFNVEQVGFASTAKADWLKFYLPGLRRTAWLCARWSISHGVGLHHSTSNGICQHVNLGAAGGGHWDCGPGYPERFVRVWAMLIRWRLLNHPGGRRGKLLAESRKRRVQREIKRYNGGKLPIEV